MAVELQTVLGLQLEKVELKWEIYSWLANLFGFFVFFILENFKTEEQMTQIFLKTFI